MCLLNNHVKFQTKKFHPQIWAYMISLKHNLVHRVFTPTSLFFALLNLTEIANVHVTMNVLRTYTSRHERLSWNICMRYVERGWHTQDIPKSVLCHDTSVMSMLLKHHDYDAISLAHKCFILLVEGFKKQDIRTSPFEVKAI